MPTKNDKQPWVAEVDGKLHAELLSSARVVLENAKSMLSDSVMLVENNRLERGFALAILAQEEFGKCFLLANCAFQRRWDSEVYVALTHHEKKQALVDAMLYYLEWFKSANSFALSISAAALIPPSIKTLPNTNEFNELVNNIRKLTIKRKNTERAKQRALYVAINKDAGISSNPKCSFEETNAEVDKARAFQDIAVNQLKHVSEQI